MLPPETINLLSSKHTCSANQPYLHQERPQTPTAAHCPPAGNASDPGLMVLSLQRIFAAAASNVCAGEEVEVCCSYIEVYNEVSAAGGRKGGPAAAGAQCRALVPLLLCAGAYRPACMIRSCPPHCNRISHPHPPPSRGNSLQPRQQLTSCPLQMIYDLLVRSSTPLELREDPEQGVTVAGITRPNVTTAAQVMALLEEGNTRRKTDSTDANSASSRSHAVRAARCLPCLACCCWRARLCAVCSNAARCTH